MQSNLDAIFLHKNNNEIELVLVEAKAHLKELESITASDSNEQIKKAFSNTQQNLNITNLNWFGKYYQLANRLALINFFNHYSNVKIKTSLLYIYFLNGYDKRKLDKGKVTTIEDKSVKNQIDWENVINNQYNELGIIDAILKNILKIYIDCK